MAGPSSIRLTMIECETCSVSSWRIAAPAILRSAPHSARAAKPKRHDSLPAFGRGMLGTALLLAIVVGSGIMGERLAGGNNAIALLGNTIATGAGLIVLIHMFGPVSGAHFNP